MILLLLLISVNSYAAVGWLYNGSKFQAFDADGVPLTGGKLHTYTCGTTTNKTTYPTTADATAETNANANPVILDSRGEASIWAVGCNKFVLKTSADVTIWSDDNITDMLILSEDATFLVEHLSTGKHDLTTYYPDATAIDQCITGSNNTLKYYIDTIGSIKLAIIRLKHTGTGTTTDYTCSTTEIVTSNITLKFDPGAVLIDDANNASLSLIHI